MDIRRGFKVVEKKVFHDQERYFSCWVGQVDLLSTKAYSKEHWTRRDEDHGPLCVFANWNDAYLFIRGNHTANANILSKVEWIIMECLYEYLTPYFELWTPFIRTYLPPPTTVFAEKVILI